VFVAALVLGHFLPAVECPEGSRRREEQSARHLVAEWCARSDGVKDGPEAVYYPNGVRAAIIHYRNGVRDGAGEYSYNNWMVWLRVGTDIDRHRPALLRARATARSRPPRERCLAARQGKHERRRRPPRADRARVGGGPTLLRDGIRSGVARQSHGGVGGDGPAQRRVDAGPL
jgi:hypothetical protein